MAEPAFLTETSPAPTAPVLRVAPNIDHPAGPGERSGSARRPQTPRLELPPYSLAAALGLEMELQIGHVLAQVLVRRGLEDPEEARAFLQASQEHPPSTFAGMAAAAETVQRHLAAGTPITVHGDYDVDGVCATAILVGGLRSLGGRVDWFIPGRSEDGYGLSAGTVRRLVQRGTRLLITVDCAITAVDEVTLAREAGLEVVVTDHHHPRPDGSLPDCPIVHPALGGYPCPDLCGSAVAHKLAQALGAPTTKDDIELVALATVADLMPLRGENRHLVRTGLAALGSTARPGLRALMAVAGADPSALSTHSLGFRLAPRINAAGRLARADAALELLLTDDPRRAEEIATELNSLNAERRAVEQRILWEAEAQVADLGERPGYVLAAEGWHPGVVGIVASRIAERHHRPAVLVALEGETGTGSARSIPGFDLLAALHACAEHLERYGGHRAAAGVSLNVGGLEAFRAAFETHAAEVLTPDLLAGVEKVDAVVCGSELGLDLLEELELLEPTGAGNPAPRLLIPGGRLADLRPMGEGRHARFKVVSGGARTPAVAFGCDGSLRDRVGEPMDASFRLERNCWNGSVEPRLVLRQNWPCAPEEVLVVGEGESYLGTVIREAERPLDAAPREWDQARTVLDRRGHSSLSVLADALSAGRTLAVCTDVVRRLGGLRRRLGGFALSSYYALELDPTLADGFEHVVALDPPACAEQDRLVRSGAGFTHLAWGEAELRFAQQMHDFEYNLRSSLVALYRGLRLRQRAVGEDLERLLRGDTSPGRPASLAGRLVRVLAELDLASFDRDLPALALTGGAQTALERSPAYRVYAHRHEDGRRFLSNVNRPPRS